ncbi:MAG: hypothetical protein ABIJ08_02585 [Nanoarchaeota archaeon]
MTTKKRPRIIVAGNATIDAFVFDPFTVSDDGINLHVQSDWVTESFRVDDAPVKLGYKHRVNQPLDMKVMGLKHQNRPGGGGYNSISAISELRLNWSPHLIYIDVSYAHMLITRGLRENGITHHFFEQRPVPTNIILGGREDKILLKGPQLGRVDPDEEHVLTIADLLKGADSMLINSVKDPGFVSQYIEKAKQNNISLYFVVTTSLDRQFLKDNVFPAGVLILNYDDLWHMHHDKDPNLDEKEKLELAKETLANIRRDGLSPYNIYVTLGKNGMYCSSPLESDKFYHVELRQQSAKQVKRSVFSNSGSTLGAGDVTAGSILAYERAFEHGILSVERNQYMPQIAMLASQAAIEHLGCKKYFDFDCFQVREINFR